MSVSTLLPIGALASATAMAAALALGLPLDARAQGAKVAAATTATPPSAAQHWSAWGGTVGIRWNRELAADLGLQIGPAQGRHAQLSWLEHETFDLQNVGSLDFEVQRGGLRRFVGGELRAAGGHVLDFAGGRIDLTQFRLVPRTGLKPGAAPILDLVGADGRAWFFIDHLMYGLVDRGARLAVRTMDLRITPELAQRLGMPEVAGWVVADMEMSTEVQRRADDPAALGAYVPKWHGQAVPGVPGATYQADLFMSTFTAAYSRCDGCTGVGGSGRVVFTPSSALRNNVNSGSAVATVPGDPRGTSSALYAADIPWYEKFMGNFPPYNNDQHPYLIWNLYRVNADGSIDQIGRSGVKHAFLTINTSCLEDPGNSHILGRGCVDVYAVSNNDSNNSLGPRSEIIPATNQWGRCGSIYDTNCDGVQNSSGNGVYDQRLVVRESQISGAPHAGATYLFESWYLARQDIDILNSMASRPVTFTRSGTVWAVGNGTSSAQRLGPAIDRWVDPSAPGPNASSTEVRTPEGQLKVAVRVTSLGGGLWRYHYAVMNLDFARAITSGSEPNLRVLSNRGLATLAVPTYGATISELVFSDGDLEASNDWLPRVSAREVSWTAPTGHSLDWGTMFRFSFVSNRGPSRGAVQLGVLNPGIPKSLKAGGVLTPAAPRTN